MVNKRLFILVLEEHNYSDDINIRKYTYSSLEYAVYNGFRHILDKYLEVNGIAKWQFRDAKGKSYDECLSTYECELSLGTNGITMYVEKGEVIDDELLDDFLEDLLKIKEEEN